MKNIDIREYTGKEDHTSNKTTTSQFRFYKDWVSYKVGTKDGWFVFNRILKSKKLGRKWYVGYSMTFTTAIAKARKLYNVNIPSTSGWTIVSVKHYNLVNFLDYKTIIYIINQIKTKP